jgi:hypothetical protein
MSRVDKATRRGGHATSEAVCLMARTYIYTLRHSSRVARGSVCSAVRFRPGVHCTARTHSPRRIGLLALLWTLSVLEGAGAVELAQMRVATREPSSAASFGTLLNLVRDCWLAKICVTRRGGAVRSAFLARIPTSDTRWVAIATPEITRHWIGQPYSRDC